MRKTMLTTALAGAMIVSTIAPAGARPTSTYEMSAQLTGAAAGSVVIGFSESAVTSVTITQNCAGGGEETWGSEAVDSSSVSFDNRLSNVSVSADVRATHVDCLGATSEGVAVSAAFMHGQRAGRTERTRSDGVRHLTTPISVGVQLDGLFPQGVMGSFAESISN